MKIAVIGEGGHSKVIQEIISLNKQAEIVAVLDDKYQEIDRKNRIFVGPIKSATILLQMFGYLNFIIAIGNNQIRKSIVDKLKIPDHCYVTLKHSTSWVSPSAKIGNGTVIMAHSVINADSEIGGHSIVNTRAVVEHDSVLKSFVHISPNATLTGAVKIGKGVHVGAGATVIPNIEIGEWSVIGAGSTVIRSIPSYCTAVGVPAKVKYIKVKEGV